MTKKTRAMMIVLVGAAAAGPACGGGSENDGGLIDAAAPLDSCEALLAPAPSRRAGMYVVDTRRDDDHAPTIRLRVDGCVVGERLPRGGLHGVGFAEGRRVFSVEMSDRGEVVSAPAVDTVAGDQVYYALDRESPPNIVGGAKGRSIPPDDGWAVMVMNMSATPITISRVVDPDATPRRYEVLASEVGYGESMLPRVLPASAAHGAWVRVERGGEVIFEDNPLFFRQCETWPMGGNAVFMLFEDAGFPYSVGVMYGSLELGCPDAAAARPAGSAAGAAAGIGTIVRFP